MHMGHMRYLGFTQNRSLRKPSERQRQIFAIERPGMNFDEVVARRQGLDPRGRLSTYVRESLNVDSPPLKIVLEHETIENIFAS